MIYKGFSPKQLTAMTWWNRPQLKDYDGILCDGAIRSGKTVSMTVGFFLWSMATYEDQVFGICGKTIGALRRNLIIHLADWLGDTFCVTEHRSENRLTVRCGRKKNTYYLFGGQDETSYALIQGITLAGIMLDEAALMPQSFVEQACARCSVSGSKLWFNCNPGSPEHWLHRKWIQKAGEKNLLHLRFTMDDNPSLDPKIRARYETLYTGVFYRRYILGQWCAAEGLIYDFSEEKHICSVLPKTGRYYISVDYGTQNPFSAGLWCVQDGNAVRIREFYYSGRATGRQRTDEAYYEDLVNLAGDYPVEQVIVDPSAASFIAVIRHHGRFRVRKAKNDVLPGIRLVASLLQRGKLLIGASCGDTIREFGLYRWEEGRDVPVKEDDHTMDDIRYFAMSVMRREKGEM